MNNAASKKSPPRPRPAGTLVLLKGDRVLMGKRNRNHTFLPEFFAFPGGTLERADSYTQPASDFQPEELLHLRRDLSEKRGIAYASAAIRETWEETGLCIGESTKEPDLNALRYLGRAITPPQRPRRYDARFFLAHAESARGTLAGNGELVDLGWIRIATALELDTAPVTRLMLRFANAIAGGKNPFEDPDKRPFFHWRNGEHRVVYK